MTKPDDISHAAWRVAAEITKAQPTAYGWRVITEAVARAIDAAKAEQREADAKLLDAVTHALKETSPRTRNDHVIGPLLIAAMSDLAAGIRNERAA